MSKLFQQMPLGTEHVSLEAFKTFKNDKVVKLLNKEVKAIMVYLHKYQKEFDDTKDMFRNNVIKEHILNMEKIIHDRFKIKVKLFAETDGSNSAMIIPPAKASNPVDVMLNSNFRDKLQLEIDTNSGRGVVNLDNYNSVNDFKDAGQFNETVLTMYEDLERVLKTDEIVVDIKKVEIRNLPDTYRPMIFLDLYTGFLINNFASREMLSVLFHELGHIFDTFMNTIRNTQNTSALLDSLMEDISKYGKEEAVKLLAIRYNPKDNTLKELNPDNKKDMTVIAIDAIKAFDGEMRVNRLNFNYLRDEEHMADVFASRFGLGAELVVADKKSIKGEMIRYIFNDLDEKLFNIGLTTMAMLLFPAITLITVPVVLAIVLKFHNNKKSPMRDDNYRRYERMGLDSISQLKSTDLDDETIKSIIKDYDTISKLLTETEKYDGLIETISSVLFKKDSTRFLLMDRTIEDLMSNELHVSSNRIKQFL